VAREHRPLGRGGAGRAGRPAGSPRRGPVVGVLPGRFPAGLGRQGRQGPAMGPARRNPGDVHRRERGAGLVRGVRTEGQTAGDGQWGWHDPGLPGGARPGPSHAPGAGKWGRSGAGGRSRLRRRRTNATRAHLRRAPGALARFHWPRGGPSSALVAGPRGDRARRAVRHRRSRYKPAACVGPGRGGRLDAPAVAPRPRGCRDHR
jgi:hypothetical protein